jgi:hypothetical protein
MPQTEGVATMKTAAKPKNKLIVHPKPTAIVVKQLYGTAFRCGEPECGRPLYRVNDETGETVLNSQVAHIHARSEGGPRWKEGMSAEENRSPDNLMPLCFEHAFEIDQSEKDYPAELLFGWKKDQLAECRELQKSWTLTDDEADEVRRRSFDSREQGHATASAHAVMQAIKEVGVLIELAQSLRRFPAGIAAEWRSRLAQANATSFMYDAGTGERLLVDLSRGERRDLSTRLRQALADACAGLESQVATVKGLALAISIETALAPWCSWLRLATDDVMHASARWPANGAEDDTQLRDALENLERSSLALGKKARGEEAEQPPEVTKTDVSAPQETDSQRRGREHREVLDAARPWSRVDHLDFDVAVYDALLKASTYAAGLPTIPTLMSLDLEATARLAARVARNADEETQLALVAQARGLSPLAVASALLWNIAQVAEDASVTTVQVSATEALMELLRDESWSTVTVWEDNAMHGRRLLGLTEYLVGSDHVRTRIRDALEADSSLIRPMLVALAQWGESRDSETFTELLGLICSIRDLPEWLPTSSIVAAIENEMPEVKPRRDDDGADPDPERLAGQLLHLAGRDQGI